MKSMQRLDTTVMVMVTVTVTGNRRCCKAALESSLFSDVRYSSDVMQAMFTLTLLQPPLTLLLSHCGFRYST